MSGEPRFRISFWKWGVWFRVFGVGLSIKYDRPPVILFSERYGYRKVWRIGPWKIIRLEAWK